MKRILVAAAITGSVSLGLAAPAFAVTASTTPGQPNQSCLSGTAPNEPGDAANASGSAFNETGPGTGGANYAGNGDNTTDKTFLPSQVVAQYDVACFQVSNNP